MTVTRVPIQPIAKGSLAKLWFAILIVVMLAGVAAWAGLQALPQSAASFLASNADQPGVVTTPSGLQYKELVKGVGPSPTPSDVTLINFEGRLLDDTIFDKAERAVLPVTGSIPGFSEALQKMQRGGKYRVWIPADLGYGSEDKIDPQSGAVRIPANSLLIFDVELLEFIPEAQLRAMQQMQQQGAMPPQMPQEMPQ